MSTYSSMYSYPTATSHTGKTWSDNDLNLHHITVKLQSPQEFFHLNADPSLKGIEPSIMNSAVKAEDVSDTTSQYLSYLDLATNYAHQESFIHDFSRETLRFLGFEERGSVLSTHYTIPRSTYSQGAVAQIDVCLLDQRSTIVLLLQLDKLVSNSTIPEPQLIVAAIAAYQHNNKKRQIRGLPSLETMTIPCITMVGTQPTFYLVPVSRALSSAVMAGQYPRFSTEVMKCVTFLGPDRRSCEGMETPEYRRLAFQQFLAFKDLAKTHWETFLV